MSIRDQSIEQIEGKVWPEPLSDDPTVLKFHKARKTPLKDLSDEELHLLFEQDIVREHLLPIILEVIQERPFTEKGELLETVLSFFNHKQMPGPDEVFILKAVLEGIPMTEFEELSSLEMLVEYFKDQYF